MVPDFLTTSIAVLAVGIGVLYTYFGYSFVTRLTSLFGGLGGALVGSVTTRLFISSTFGTASPFELILVSLAGAFFGGIIGSYLARSLQQVATIATCFVISSSLLYWGLTHPSQLGAIPNLSPLPNSVSPAVIAMLFGGVVSIFIWKFYFLFLVSTTSLVGASLLQQFAFHWSTLLPIFQSETWTTLGTNVLLWLLLIGSGIIVQYRRYRGISPQRYLRHATSYRLR